MVQGDSLCHYICSRVCIQQTSSQADNKFGSTAELPAPMLGTYVINLFALLQQLHWITHFQYSSPKKKKKTSLEFTVACTDTHVSTSSLSQNSQTWYPQANRSNYFHIVIHHVFIWLKFRTEFERHSLFKTWLYFTYAARIIGTVNWHLSERPCS